MTFEEASVLTDSEKVLLITAESSILAKIFQPYSGNIYYRDVPYFVSDVKQNGISLEYVPDKAIVSSGNWTYEPSTGKVYVNILGDQDPKTAEISIVFRHFFSNKPVILPYDLSSGEKVEWLPLVGGIGSIGQQLDDENTGIVLESQSSITLINDFTFFSNIFDRHIWENKATSFYYWFTNTDISEARKIFDGVIVSKSYASDKIIFKVKDYVYKLKNHVNSGLFSSSDGILLDSVIGTPKRRIYGKIDRLKTVSLDCVKDGFTLTGTISVSENTNLLTGTADAVYVSNDLTGTVTATAGTRTITGTGTSFLTQLSVNQLIRITNGTLTYIYRIKSIASATSLTTSELISASFTTFTAKNWSSGNLKVYGVGTIFTKELQNGSKVRFTNGTLNYDYSVESIENDNELTLSSFISVAFSGFSIRNLDIKNNILVGSGTNFLSELTVGDQLVFKRDSGDIKCTIESVYSNTIAKISENTTEAIINEYGINKPSTYPTKKNRKWHIAGHKIRKSTAVITSIINGQRYIVDDVSEFSAGDLVTVGTTTTQINKISENQIVLDQFLFPIPLVGDSIEREPITSVYYGEEQLVLNRDYSLINTTEAILVIDELAEFNIARENLTSISLTFTNGSNYVYTRNQLDMRTIIKPKDWIRNITQTTITWYQVKEVSQTSLDLITNFSGQTVTENAYIKNINQIKDDSLITVDCYGYDYQNKWVKTASDCVRHLVKYDAEFTSINEDSFSQASSDCDYVISFVIPENIGDESIQVRDAITKINETVNGSLFGNSAQEITYAIVNTRKEEGLSTLKDDDIISWSVSTSGNICSDVKINFRPFVDRSTGENGFYVVTFLNEFVKNNIGVKNTIEKNCYVYNLQDALIIAQRTAFFNSLNRSMITINSGLNLVNYNVNDRIYIDLDRLYERYGSVIKRKIGLISSVKKDSYTTEITVNDIGNIFNRCMSLAPSLTNSFSASSEDEKMKYGFFLDGETYTPETTNEDCLGTILLG